MFVADLGKQNKIKRKKKSWALYEQRVCMCVCVSKQRLMEKKEGRHGWREERGGGSVQFSQCHGWR